MPIIAEVQKEITKPVEIQVPIIVEVDREIAKPIQKQLPIIVEVQNENKIETMDKKQVTTKKVPREKKKNVAEKNLTNNEIQEITENKLVNEVIDNQNSINSNQTDPKISSPTVQVYQRFLRILSKPDENSIQEQKKIPLNILLANKVVRKKLKELHANILENPSVYLPQLEEIAYARLEKISGEKTEEYESQKEMLQRDFKEIRNYYQNQEELSKRVDSILKNLQTLSYLYITPQANMLNVTSYTNEY